MENREVFGEMYNLLKIGKSIINDNVSGYRKDGITRIDLPFLLKLANIFVSFVTTKTKIKYVRPYCNVKILDVRE